MSKYLSSSYYPVVFEDSVVDIIHAVGQLTDVNRQVPIPRTNEGYLYNRTLYSKVVSLVILLGGQVLNDRPAVLAETETTVALVGSIINKHDLEWGLMYSKEERKFHGKNGKEVSLSNVKKYSSDLVVSNITMEIDSLREYLIFVETELEFLDAVQESLTPEVGVSPKKGPSSIVSKPVDKNELERFKGIAEKMRLLQQSSTKDDVNPDDLW